MEKPVKLRDESIGRLLLEYSVPTIIGMLVFATYSVVDRIFIGRAVGSVGIGAVSLTFPIFMILMAVGMLVGIGTGTLISIRMGEGKTGDAEKLAGNAFSLLVIIGASGTLIGLTYIDRILYAFGASANTFPYARDFMHVIFWGVTFNFIAMGMNNVIRAEGNPKIAMKTMLIGAVLNLILNPLFIFGFNMGVRGSAMATVISNIVTSAWVMFHFTYGKSNLKLRLINLKINLRTMMPAFAIGLSPFSMQLAASLVNVIANRSLLHYGGDTAVSAMGVISAIAMFILLPIMGINQGAQPIIGFNYGAREFARVRKTVLLAISAASVVSCGGFLAVFLAPEFIIRIFDKNSAELVKIGAPGMQTFLFLIPVLGFQAVGTNFFQAIGKPRMSIFLSLLRQVLLLIPFLLIFPKYWGLDGIWLASPVSDLIAALTTAVFLFAALKRLGEDQAREDSAAA